jgi:hypothetical protein
MEAGLTYIHTNQLRGPLIVPKDVTGYKDAIKSDLGPFWISFGRNTAFEDLGSCKSINSTPSIVNFQSPSVGVSSNGPQQAGPAKPSSSHQIQKLRSRKPSITTPITDDGQQSDDDMVELKKSKIEQSLHHPAIFQTHLDKIGDQIRLKTKKINLISKTAEVVLQKEKMILAQQMNVEQINKEVAEEIADLSEYTASFEF